MKNIYSMTCSVPRPPSPSVFGAGLDRPRGIVRLFGVLGRTTLSKVRTRWSLLWDYSPKLALGLQALAEVEIMHLRINQYSVMRYHSCRPWLSLTISSCPLQCPAVSSRLLSTLPSSLPYTLCTVMGGRCWDVHRQWIFISQRRLCNRNKRNFYIDTGNRIHRLMPKCAHEPSP